MKVSSASLVYTVCTCVCTRVCVSYSVCVRVQYADVRTAQLINLDIDDTDDMQTQVWRQLRPGVAAADDDDDQDEEDDNGGDDVNIHNTCPSLLSPSHVVSSWLSAETVFHFRPLLDAHVGGPNNFRDFGAASYYDRGMADP